MTTTLLPRHVPITVAYRGAHPENIHHGSVAVVDASGRLLASVGDIETPLFTRSSLKPFQAMPLIAQAAERFAERNSSSPEQKELMLSASRTALQTFVRAGFDGLISRVPEAERERILGFAIPMIQFTLSELRDLLRQQQGLPELD